MGFSSQLTQWHLIPAISAELVRDMKKLGVKQAKIARLIGVTPAAVSQYLKGKRGIAFEFDAGVKKLIADSAKRMAAGDASEEDMLREICELCISARKSAVAAYEPQ